VGNQVSYTVVTGIHSVAYGGDFCELGLAFVETVSLRSNSGIGEGLTKLGNECLHEYRRCERPF